MNGEQGRARRSARAVPSTTSAYVARFSARAERRALPSQSLLTAPRACHSIFCNRKFGVLRRAAVGKSI
jgi:hypothetical protein